MSAGQVKNGYAKFAAPWWWALRYKLPKQFIVAKPHVDKANAYFDRCGYVLKARRRYDFPTIQLSETPLPEVAVIGQPNSGKSTLLKAMLPEGAKIKIGKYQHVTKHATFYGSGSKFYLVDMPGYVGEERFWSNIINRELLQRRPCLKTVFFLVEANRGLDDVDRARIEHLEEYHVPYTFVITKCDVASEECLTRTIDTIRGILRSEWQYRGYKEVFLTSGETGVGIDELKCYVIARCGLM